MKRKICEHDFDLQANAAKIRDLIWLVFDDQLMSFPHVMLIEMILTLLNVWGKISNGDVTSNIHWLMTLFIMTVITHQYKKMIAGFIVLLNHKHPSG